MGINRQPYLEQDKYQYNKTGLDTDSSVQEKDGETKKIERQSWRQTLCKQGLAGNKINGGLPGKKWRNAFRRKKFPMTVGGPLSAYDDLVWIVPHRKVGRNTSPDICCRFTVSSGMWRQSAA